MVNCGNHSITTSCVYHRFLYYCSAFSFLSLVLGFSHSNEMKVIICDGSFHKLRKFHAESKSSCADRRVPKKMEKSRANVAHQPAFQINIRGFWIFTDHRSLSKFPCPLFRLLCFLDFLSDKMFPGLGLGNGMRGECLQPVICATFCHHDT